MFTSLQLKLIAEFFANLAVIWFGAAFITSTNLITSIQAGLNGIFALIIGIILMKGVKE